MVDHARVISHQQQLSQRRRGSQGSAASPQGSKVKVRPINHTPQYQPNYTTGVCNVDILLSEEAPESDYEYVNPVHVVLIDDDKDQVATKPSSPISRTPDNSTDSNNISPRSKHPSTPEPPRQAPAGSRLKSKPVSLPPMPTVSQATSAEKRRGPPVPPRKQPGTSDKLHECVDRDGYLECVFMSTVDDDHYDDVCDSRSEPTEPQDSGHRRQTSHRRRRANSVDSLLDCPPLLATSLSDSESTLKSHRQKNCPPPPSCRPSSCRPPTTTLKFRGDLGLVPTNIASLSVEEVND